MSLRLRVVRGAASLAGARIAVSILNTFSILVLARLLTPEDFGVVAISTVTLSIILSLTEMSVRPALVQCEDPSREHIDTVWTILLIRAALVFGFFAVAAWPMAQIYGSYRLISVLIVTGLTGAFMEFYNPLITVATRDMRFRPLITFQICQKLIALSIAIGLALIFRSFWAIIIGNALGAVLVTLASYVIMPYLPRFSLSKIKEIWHFSGWILLSQLFETLNWRFDQMAISLVVPRAQLGIYSIADNLAVIPTREVSGPMKDAMFPGLASLAKFPERLRTSYLKGQSTVAMVSAPAAIGLALVADPAVHVILGEKWMASAPFVQLIALSYALETFASLVRPLGMGMGQTRPLFLAQLAALLIKAPLILLGLFMGGMIGATIGRAVSGLMHCHINFMVVRKLLQVSIWQQLKVHGTTLAGLFAMSIAVISINRFLLLEGSADPLAQLAILTSVGALTYVCTIMLVWTAANRPDGPVPEILDIAVRISGFGIAKSATKT